MRGDREQRLVFDEVAEQYDARRPGYPPELVADVLRWAELPAGGRILEVGCGTGKATAAFAGAAAEHPLLAVEPGEQMAAVAARNCADFPNVEIRTTTFENAELERGGFGLLISGQAFHWVDPGRRYGLADRALRPGGALAVFLNRPEVGDGERDRAIQRVYERFAPRLARHTPGANHSQWKGPDDEMRASDLFEDVRVCAYPHAVDYTTDQYLELLGTHSDHRLLPDAARRRLHGELGSTLDRFGGGLRVDYTAELYFGRTRRAR